MHVLVLTYYVHTLDTLLPATQYIYSIQYPTFLPAHSLWSPLTRYPISQSYTKGVNDEGFTLLMLHFSCANIFWFNSSERFSDEVSTLFYGALHNHKLASWLLVKHILLVNKEESSLVTLFFLHPPNEVSAINKRTCSVLWLCFVLLHFVFVKP